MTTTHTIQFSCGTRIDEAAQQLVYQCDAMGRPCTGDFNGITLRAEAGTSVASIVKAFEVECDKRYQAHIASPEYAAQQIAIKQADEQRKVEAAAALEGAPDMLTLSNPEGWAQSLAANKDGYGAATLRYAEQWARMMEAAMAKGQTLKECAEPTSRHADTEGISGAMHGFAVGILSQVWVHGEGLRAAVR